MSKKITVLGSTGSIGRQTLEVVAAYPEELSIVALVAYSNARVLAQQIEQFRPRLAVLVEPQNPDEISGLSYPGVEVMTGEEGLLLAACLPEADLIVAAMVGIRSLPVLLAAIETGKNIALANKEILVAAGRLVMDKARHAGVRILPVDSEHSAIHQCINKNGQVVQVIITASGGPLRNMSREEMEAVTPEQALKHPTWSMGPKITVDSSTLMNKGLEVIEAKHLFDLEYDQIEVLVHPQSIVHALVRYNDGSLFAHLGPPDMRIPIQYALTWPERWELNIEKLDLGALGRLDFSYPDLERFPCLQLACQAGRAGKTYPAVLNAADEVAVRYFLDGKIKLTDINRVVAAVLEKHQPLSDLELDQIMAAHEWASKQAMEIVKRIR